MIVMAKEGRMVQHTVKVSSLMLFHPSLPIKLIVASTAFVSQSLPMCSEFFEAPAAANAKQEIADSRI